MRIGWYIRVSTQEQSESLAMYRSQAQAFCERYEHTLIDIYSDEDVSGGIELFKRPAGKALLQAFQDKQIDAVASPNVSRLFRDLRDGINTLHQFGINNWAMFCGDGYGLPLDVNTPMGFSMVVDQLKYAQIERMNISERTTRGLAFRRKKQMATSHTPYGWKRVEGSTQMIEDETEKVFVNKILSMNNEGICDSQIAKHLTSINAPTKKGGKWHPITVTKIINYHTLCQAK